MRTWRFKSSLQLVHCRRPSHSVYERQSDSRPRSSLLLVGIYTLGIGRRVGTAKRRRACAPREVHPVQAVRGRAATGDTAPQPTPDKSRPFESRHSAVITTASFPCAGAHQPMGAAVLLVCHCGDRVGDGRCWRCWALLVCPCCFCCLHLPYVACLYLQVSAVVSGQTAAAAAAADVFGQQRRGSGEHQLNQARLQTAERSSRKRKEREGEGNGTLQGSSSVQVSLHHGLVEAQAGFRRARFLYLGAARVRAPKVPASLGRARIDTSLVCVLTRARNASDLAFERTLLCSTTTIWKNRATRRIRSRTQGLVQCKQSLPTLPIGTQKAWSRATTRPNVVLAWLLGPCTRLGAWI